MRAAVAVAHKILIVAYHILSTGESYAELGEGYLDAIDKHRTAHHLIQRLAALGYRVTLEEPADVAAALQELERDGLEPAAEPGSGAAFA